MPSTHLDQNSFLRSTDAALVVDRDGVVTLRLPRYPTGGRAPEMVRLLAAVLLRSQDEDWVRDTLSVL